MAEFHFLRPEWLAGIPLALLLVWMLARAGFSRSAWERLCDAPLLRELAVGVRARADWIPLAGVGLIWVLACLALAGPAWQQQPEPVYSRAHSRVILFDLSQSMDSTDLVPSRLTRARFKLSDLVSAAGDREQALAVFAGDAFVVSPLTDDSATLTNLIPSLATDTVPVQGSRVDKALQQALDLLTRSGARSGDVILISDGLDMTYAASARTAAEAIAAAGHRLLILGVGTPEGSPVPLADGGFLVDAGGNIVIPRLARGELQRLASLGGGNYLDMRVDGSDISQLNAPPLATRFGSDAGLAAGELSRWVDRGVTLLIPLLILGSLGFRRGWLLMALVALPIAPFPAQALDWESLWSRSDQRAAEAMATEEYGSVPASAGRRWRAAAAYRQGDYEAAVGFGAGAESASDHYNLGNALARSGDLAAAADAYRDALELAPEMADAQHNLALVEELMQQQSQQQQQQQQNGDQGEQQPDGENSQQDQSEESAGDDNAEPNDQGQSDSGDSQQADQGSDPTENQSGQGDQEEAPDDPQEEQPSVVGSEQDAADEPGGETGESLLADMSEVEQEQAMQQWLNQVPDDPGGLLKRKFHYQHGLRQDQGGGAQQW